MSKGLRLFVAVAMLAGILAIAPVHVALAQNTQFTAYSSGIQVANLDTAEANVVLIGYKADGIQSGTALSDKIPVSSSKTYFPISNVENGFSGSFVISSDKKIAAISNLVIPPNFAASASYVGRSGGSTTVLLPLLQKGNNGFTSWYSVQNAGTGPANITVTYSSGLVSNASIPAGAAKVFYQAAENHNNIKVFAATITGNQPLVAAVIQETPKALTAYTGFTGTGPLLPVFPLVNSNNRGTITGIQIQNGGTVPTTVTLSYTPGAAPEGAGTACTETKTIQPKASETFALRAFAPLAQNDPGENCVNGQRFVGAAAVTTNSANQPLVGVANQAEGTQFAYGGTYAGFDPAEAGQNSVMPLIMDKNAGFFTGFAVQNVGTVATDVTCSFARPSSPPGGETYKVQVNLTPNAGKSNITFGVLPAGFVGAGTCTAANAAAKIVTVVNQVSPFAGDNLSVYEGVKK